MRIPLILCGLGLCVGLWTGTGCQPGSQDTQTETSEGSETGTCTPGSESCTCGEGASCEPGLLCASGVCIPDTQMTGSETGSPVTTTVGTTENASVTETSDDPTAMTMTETSGPPLDCDPEGGIVGAECGESAPYCSPRGKCVACDAIDCSEVSSQTPACDPSGACVECTADDIGACQGATPICSDSVCVPCTEHEQCPSGACQLETGACFETVLHVDRGASCAGGDGSPDLPFCEIKDAVAEVAQAEPTAIFVKGNTTPYTGQVQIPPNRTIAILREGTGIAKIEVEALDSVQVSDGATLYMHEMQISKGDVTKGLFCTGATVWLDRTQVVDRKGLGIDSSMCKLVLRRSRVYLNLAGGLKLSGGSTRIENSYIATNGGSFAAIAGLVLSNGATLDAVYTTIVDNDGKAGIEDSLDCTGAGEVKLRNSIVFGKTDVTSVGCAGATASYSVVDSGMLTGEMNTVIKVPMQEWFIEPETGNFGVNPGAPFEDVAQWKTGDPAVDFDGTARPDSDGAPDYVGADRPI